MADNELDNFKPADVSKPVRPRKEAEIIAELKDEYRRDWIRSHLTHIFVVVGIIAVAAVFLIIHFYNQNSNPVNRLIAAAAKDFSGPFAFDVTLSKDDAAAMSYSGSVDVNSRKQTIKIAYDADYSAYSFKGIVYADDGIAEKGFYYKDKWTIRDCREQVVNFFDFDSDFRAGNIDSGALLRFTDLTSRYSAGELDEFFKHMRERLAADSPAAKITMTKENGAVSYTYDFDVYEVFRTIVDEGAPLFYSADSYNEFKESFELNEATLREAECTMTFDINSSGYLTAFTLSVAHSGHSYKLDCAMSDFNIAVTEIPADFLEAATSAPETEG